MTLPLDDLITIAGNRPPDTVGTIDQAAAAVRDAAAAEGIDLLDPETARHVTFGAHCPLYIASALDTPRGAVALARHVTAAAAAATEQESAA